MPRNPDGSYVLPAGNPVTTHTTISSTWANSTLGDIAVALGASLDRTGSGAMQAPLLLVDGSLAAPALAFANEPSSGLFRNTGNDVQMVIGGILSQRWLATGVSIPKGLTVTQSQANLAGVTATGNGTAAGVVAMGGGTNGVGLSGTGGGPDSAGVSGQGVGAGAGITGIGGGTNGTGGSFTGGATNATGVSGTGSGTGAGAVFIGGPTNGKAIVATGTGTGQGLSVTGGASASAIQATSGNSGQAAVVATGIGGGLGLRANSNLNSHDVAAFDGYLDMSGGATVAYNQGFTNRLTSKNIAKAWGVINIVHGVGASVLNGFNLDQPVIGFTGGTTAVTVFFLNPMNAINFNYNVSYENTVSATSATVVLQPATFQKTAVSFSFRVQATDNSTGGSAFVDFAVANAVVSFSVFGEQ